MRQGAFVIQTSGGKVASDLGSAARCDAPHRHVQRQLMWAALACLIFPCMANADTPIAKLRRGIGPDSALAIELSGLPGLFQKVRESEWLKRTHGSELAERWRGSPGFAEFTRTLAEVERRLEQSVPSVIDGLAHEGLIFVLETPRTDQPTGWLLAGSGANPQRVAELVARWNRLEQAQTTERSGDGFEWTERQVGNDSRGRVHYLVRGAVWAVSNRPELLRSSAERVLGEQEAVADRATLWQTELARMPERAHLRCVVRARAWDELLKIEQGLASNDIGQQFAARWWSGTDTLSFGVGFDGEGDDQGPTVEMHARWGKPTPEWLSLIQRSEGRGSFLDRAPRESLMVVSGRIQPLACWDWLPKPDDETARRDLTRLRSALKGLSFGIDLFDDVLAGLEANWGLAVVPVKVDQPGRWPLAVVSLWELPSVNRTDWDASRTRLLRRGLVNAVQTGLSIWAVTINDRAPERNARLRAAGDERGETEIVWLEGLKEFEPCFSAGSQYFALATSPSALRPFLDESPAVARWQAPASSDVTIARSRHLLIHVAVRSLREWLGTHRGELAESVATWQKLDAGAVEKRLDRLRDVLELADDLMLETHFEADGMTAKGSWSIHQ